MRLSASRCRVWKSGRGYVYEGEGPKYIKEAEELETKIINNGEAPFRDRFGIEVGIGCLALIAKGSTLDEVIFTGPGTGQSPKFLELSFAAKYDEKTRANLKDTGHMSTLDPARLVRISYEQISTQNKPTLDFLLKNNDYIKSIYNGHLETHKRF